MQNVLRRGAEKSPRFPPGDAGRPVRSKIQLVANPRTLRIFDRSNSRNLVEGDTALESCSALVCSRVKRVGQYLFCPKHKMVVET